ncbi:GNAT family N-acetyltransferase [Shewanella marina]|uniref:GNAT family N-acetyltransferase n=1 Tax=Shewanella marina TaxID=487319 RepID=UPI0004705F92|nr:GNAT family N-acetyltransferase [Shewanella marina]
MKVKATARLSFELMTAADAHLMHELDQDPEVMRYINGGVMTSWQRINEFFVPRVKGFTNNEQGWGLWKVMTHSVQENLLADEDPYFIGWVLVRPMDYYTDEPRFHDLEVGWRFKRKTWGLGYATEAALAITEALVLQPQITHLSAIALEGNLASINIMKKLGMEFVETKTELINGLTEKVVYFTKKV